MLLNSMIFRPGACVSDGNLCVAEGNSKEVPFEIKRVYYSYGAEKETIRGFHAHKTLQQILICAYGTIEVTLDDGNDKIETYILDNPTQGLYVGPSMWRTMKWQQSESVLLVLASEHYDASDYIRDYEEFVKWVQAKEVSA